MIVIGDCEDAHIVCTDIDDLYDDTFCNYDDRNLYEHRKNVSQVAIFVHRCQVVQNALYENYVILW